MRYKLIHFYLPLHHYKKINDRIKYFSFGETLKGSDITTVRPRSTITGEDGVVYNNIPGTDVYESVRSNWFIKVVAESDPLFNFDLLDPMSFYFYDADIYLKCLDTIRRVLPQFLGENILRIGIDGR